MSEKDYLYDLEDIKRLLPHRYPFLLVDRIISIDQEKNGKNEKPAVLPFFLYI